MRPPHLALPAVDQALANVLHANALDEVTDLRSSTTKCDESIIKSHTQSTLTLVSQLLHRHFIA
jgi:hypothetical protein